METINFQCGHCGKLMAVGQNLLGQQVRCPHCQQVVVAPAASAAAPAPAPAPYPDPSPSPPSPAPAPDVLQQTVINVPGMGEPESIFSPAEVSDVLSASPDAGRVEMPSEPWPQIVSQAPTEPMPAPPAPADSAVPPLTPVEPTLTYVPHVTQYPDGQNLAPTEPDAGAFSSASPAWPGAAQADATTAALGREALAQAIPTPAVRAPRDRGGWFVALVVIPLISYSILATIAVIYLRFYQPTPPPQPHPLEYLPDIEGKNKGAKRQKAPIINYKGKQKLKLPDHLRTTLAHAIQIGDLEVTPESLEFKTVTFLVPGSDPADSENECLLLNLRLKNISKDVVFKPMDPYFDRKWKAQTDPDIAMPFTYLTIGDQQFFGGPNSMDDVYDNHVTIAGQRYDRELKPGEEVNTFVCTDCEDPVKQAVESASGPMLWRVQVRRGLVEIPGKGEYSATAVIGVEFTKEEVKRGQAES
jgi:hypothetical protein